MEKRPRPNYASILYKGLGLLLSAAAVYFAYLQVKTPKSEASHDTTALAHLPPKATNLSDASPVTKQRPTTALNGSDAGGSTPNSLEPVGRSNSGKVTVDMVSIPAGEFTMGKGNGASGWVAHRVKLSAYQIGKAPVTVAQFRAYCTAVDYPYDWHSRAPKWGWPDNNPMVNVSWEEARAFCKWAGGDLPTEAQWEHAARGPEDTLYPWGDNWDQKKLWWSFDQTVVATAAVDRTNMISASVYGCTDVEGNVSQLCLDLYQGDLKGLPDLNPTGPIAGGLGHILKGRSFRGLAENQFLATNRDHVDDRGDDDIGFRLAKSVSN